MWEPNDTDCPLRKSFTAIQEKGTEKPIYRLIHTNIKPAPGEYTDKYTGETKMGKNHGSLYVYDKNYEYIAKITPLGDFYPKHGVSLSFEAEREIKRAINEPEKVAMEAGKATGTCCCCGRTLTNPLSIDLGIGPICRAGWGWDTSGAYGTDPGQLTLEDLGAPEEIKKAIVDARPGEVIPVPSINEVQSTIGGGHVDVTKLLDAYQLLSTQERIEFLIAISTYHNVQEEEV